MKIKTSDLTGVALDWAVTRANYEINYEAVWENFRSECQYSTDWCQGGPIIEREKIDLIYDERVPQWAAIYFYLPEGPEPDEYYGPTPLVAAMRCYVATKLGDTVSIPNELIEE
jgi:hypothetical protein